MQWTRTSTPIRDQSAREITFGVRLMHSWACKLTHGCNPDPIYWECFFSEGHPWYNGATSSILFSNEHGPLPSQQYHSLIAKAYHGLVSGDDSLVNKIHIHTYNHRYYLLSRSNPVEGCAGCGSASGCESPWQLTINCNWWHTGNYPPFTAEWVEEEPPSANIDVYDEDRKTLQSPVNDPIGNPDWDVCLNSQPGTPCCQPGDYDILVDGFIYRQDNCQGAADPVNLLWEDELANVGPVFTNNGWTHGRMVVGSPMWFRFHKLLCQGSDQFGSARADQPRNHVRISEDPTGPPPVYGVYTAGAIHHEEIRNCPIVIRVRLRWDDAHATRRSGGCCTWERSGMCRRGS